MYITALSAAPRNAAGITNIVGYTAIASNCTGDGSVSLDLVDNGSIVDLLGNQLGGSGTGNGNFSGLAYTLDRQAPEVLSITRTQPSPSGSTNVGFQVIFSEPVINVDINDFAAISSSGLVNENILSVSGSSDSYVVSVGDYSGQGTLGLAVVDDIEGGR